MRLAARCLGVHLRACEWRAVHVESRLASTRLVGSASGRFRNGEDLAPQVGAALEEAARALDVRPGTGLGVAIARPLAHVKQVELPTAARAEILRSIRTQAASLFPVGREPVVPDLRRMPRNGASANGASSLVAVVSEQLVEALAASAAALGLRLVTADVAPGALRQLVGKGADALLVCEPDAVEYAELGNASCVTKWLDLPIRREADCTADALRPWVEGRSVAALGAPENLPGLHDSPADGSALGVTLVELPPALKRAGVGGEFAIAFGAALEALGSRLAFDLRPERFRAADVRSSRVRTGALGAVAAATLGLYALSGFVHLRSEVTALEREVEALRPRAEQAFALQRSVGAALENVSTLIALDANRRRWTELLGQLAGSLPADAYVAELSEADGKLRLQVLATSASKVVAALEATDALAHVRVAGPVTREGTPAGERERFAIEAEWSGRPVP